jgi:GH35 family endo-1,4-beta-xylanase
MDFSWPNFQTQIATENGMETMFYSGLPFGPPSGVKNGFTQDDLDNIVRMIVENAKKYHIDGIIVVNEARIPADWVYPDIFWEKFGIAYVVRAFRSAREIYPEAMLIYNDTNIHMSGTFGTETTLLISNALYQEGLIDYVGVQMHIDPDQYPNKDEMIAVFRAYPVPVVITEFDVLLTYVPENEYDEMLNEITRIVLDGCLESQVCLNFTTWGENDSVGWEGLSLLRDRFNNRKQAYYVAMQSMFEHLP